VIYVRKADGAFESAKLRARVAQLRWQVKQYSRAVTTGLNRRLRDSFAGFRVLIAAFCDWNPQTGTESLYLPSADVD
jgi:hypothetical protein